MNSHFQRLYDRMMAEITTMLSEPDHELNKAESSYHIARKYWEDVKKDCREMIYKNALKEIEFFREVRPLFTAQIEFNILLYEALVAAPAEKHLIEKFWKGELKRCERFRQKNNEFILYYESSNRDRDHEYFIRSHKPPGILSTARIYDLGPGWYSHYGQVLGSWLAWKMYFEYIKRMV